MYTILQSMTDISFYIQLWHDVQHDQELEVYIKARCILKSFDIIASVSLNVVKN